MAFPTTGNTGPLFSRLRDIAAECALLRREAHEILKDLNPVIIGRRVKRFGRVWQISQARIGNSGSVQCYGVTVSRKGKVGTRDFDLGNLSDCDFIEEEGPGGV